MPAAEQILDGYRLIRIIGSGGFGEVWLCRLVSTGEFKALKFVPAVGTGHLERELEALIRYRRGASQLQCAHLVPIEHVNRTDDGLFYTMPLSDGLDGGAPSEAAWRAKTLSAMIERKRMEPGWFTGAEIYEMMSAVLGALQALSDAGIVHRDVKPENVLFIGGKPCLGDISLLTDDRAAITRRGTPFYAAPGWYLESGGNPDMWGAATTLFHLATGHSPDRLGRAAFLWPPQGEESLSQGERETWRRFHRVILRATRESAAERFLSLRDMDAALNPETEEPRRRQAGGRMSIGRILGITAAVAVFIVISGVLAVHHWSSKKSRVSPPVETNGRARAVTGRAAVSGGATREPPHEVTVNGNAERRAAEVKPPSTPSARPPEASGDAEPETREFDKKLATVKSNFEALLKQARANLLKSGPPKRENIEELKKLLAQMEKEATSFSSIKQRCGQIRAVIHGVNLELSSPLDDFLRRLVVTSRKPMALAFTDEEKLRAQRLSGELQAEVAEFKREIVNRNGLPPPDIERIDLNKLINSTVQKVRASYYRASGLSPDSPDSAKYSAWRDEDAQISAMTEQFVHSPPPEE